MRWVSTVMALALASCGGNVATGGMFDQPKQLYGSAIPSLLPQQEAAVIKVNVPPALAEPSILTLSPPLQGAALASSKGFQPQELANIYARLTWGGPIYSKAFIDLGSGVCFSTRGNSIQVDLINDNPIVTPPALPVIAMQAGAFLSPGDFCQGIPRRTIIGALTVPPAGAAPISLTNPLAPGVSSDHQLIPPFSRSVTVAIVPPVDLLFAPMPFFFAFFDINGTLIMNYFLNAGTPQDIEVPSDAVSVDIQNASSGGGARNIVSLRYVFDLNL
jgi:hypothetical protein